MLILPATIPLIQNIGIEVQRAVNMHKVRSYMYFAMALLNLTISIPLAVQFGPLGAASGTTISLLIANGLAMNIYYQKAIGIDVISFWKSIISLMKGLILPGCFGLFIIKMVKFSGIIDFALWILLYAAVYCISMWIFGMNKYEKDLVLSFIKR